MVKEIRMEEGKLKVIFEIRDNGVVELKQFDPAGCMRISTMSAAEPRILPIRAMRFWRMKKEKNW